jgi:DNA-binding transcriptional ArsR family regulator
MVKYSSETLDAIFSALSHPIRRAILEKLKSGSVSISEVAEPFKTSLPAISKHLRILEDAGLIVNEKEGRVHYLRLVANPLLEAVNWLADYQQFWKEQFSSLEEYLEDNPSNQPQGKTTDDL